jgi:hypothetical protein
MKRIKTTRCPTCNSPSPELHPAMQHGGEIQLCGDVWHSPKGVHQIVCDIDDLLSSKDRWTKGVWARDDSGHEINFESPDATCWCLTGALAKCTGGTPTGYHDVLPCIQCILNVLSVSSWNDDPQRTFADVKRLLAQLKVWTAPKETTP